MYIHAIVIYFRNFHSNNPHQGIFDCSIIWPSTLFNCSFHPLIWCHLMSTHVSPVLCCVPGDWRQGPPIAAQRHDDEIHGPETRSCPQTHFPHRQTEARSSLSHLCLCIPSITYLPTIHSSPCQSEGQCISRSTWISSSPWAPLPIQSSIQTNPALVLQLFDSFVSCSTVQFIGIVGNKPNHVSVFLRTFSTYRFTDVFQCSPAFSRLLRAPAKDLSYAVTQQRRKGKNWAIFRASFF